jgi:hypothetical protein
MRIEAFTVIASDPGLNPGEAIQQRLGFVAALLAMKSPSLALTTGVTYITDHLRQHLV